MMKTPRSNRIHIGIFGRTNSGKSTLMNLLTDQSVSLVTPEPGTTTDPVYKNMEVPGLGPVVFIDTAGLEDTTVLGSTREERTKEVLGEIDGALYLISDEGTSQVLEILNDKKIPTIKIDNRKDKTKKLPDTIDMDRSQILDILADRLKSLVVDRPLLEDMVDEKDTVLLIMPQDLQAPKGRLILPQVQTIRELLDRKCNVVSALSSNYPQVLETLTQSPDLIITDSQHFHTVYKDKPEDSSITSFSVLFARSKGDIDTFVSGARVIDQLSSGSKVLIVEACTHAPGEEDIGTVKIPRMIRERYGEDIDFGFSRGKGLPDDVDQYDLIIMCGSCMHNRASVLNRIRHADEAGVPITNYGITLAYLNGILDKIVF